jgi:hypothetical protein
MKTNFLAILLCAILNILLGMAWFGVFRQPWMDGHHLTEESIKSMANPYMPYVVSIVGAIVLAYAMTLIFRRMGVCSLKDGFLNGAGIGLFGLVGVIVLNMYAMNPFSLSLIDGGYAFVQLAIFGAVIGGWVKRA